ncbi:MAG TPA: WGR and DUF4132 domain-containing protein [Abditibacterium sp.]
MTQREFTYSDGKSDKFWNIAIDGESFTVSYGRSGTTGQTQTKSFDSENAAQSAADKLIAEKLKKGYVEASPSNGAPAAPTTSKTAPKVAPKPKSQKPAPEVVPEDETSNSVQVSASLSWNGDEERQLKLDARDWLWATWRPRVPESRPTLEAKPFDKEEALQSLAKVFGKYYYSPWDWSKAKISSTFGRQEAYFWFVAMTTPMKYSHTVQQATVQNEYLSQVAAHDFEKEIKTQDLIDNLKMTGPERQNQITPQLVSVLSHLITPVELLDILLIQDKNARSKNPHRHQNLIFDQSFCDGFREYILPFVTVKEAEVMRERLKTEFSPRSWPLSFYEPPKIAIFLAAQLGLHDELLAIVKGWKDDFYSGEEWHDHYHRPQEIIFGLRSAQEVEAQMRRLKLKLNKPPYIRAWLAHTEFSAPDWVKESILGARGESYRTTAKDIAEKLTKTFALAEAPEIAPEMLQLLLESKAPRVAREWLDAHPSHTLRGLAPVAAGRGKLAEAAIEQLRSLKKRGAEAAIREVAETLPSEEKSRLESMVLNWSEKTYEPFTDSDAPEAVRAALEGDPRLKTGKTAWIRATDLPPITYGSRRLSDAQVEALLVALRGSAHPLTVAVKSSADAASLDAFAWKIFERWLAESAPSKEKWAMLALGQLGGDACALKLTPMVRAWPGESQHQRAVTGLECLRAIGTDTALMQINGIAQKIKFKGLQGKAVEAMEGIASDRGLSRAQLEDRVVPTLDLDENGTRIFDFGPRQFRFVLSLEMKPLVREEGATLAKPRPDLPKPTSKDDASKAEAAIVGWKLLKKQLSETVKIQAVRLENAMVRGRRWTPEEFETLLARHPLMSNLVRLLVWEAASGNRRATFRVVEDGTYADSKDEPFDLGAGEWAHIGIAHPLHLSEAEKGAWGEIFSDYEIVPPFTQLGRAIYGLEGDEEKGVEITRFKNIVIHPQTLCFGLEKLGWERGPALDGGGFYEHYKYFESSDVTACVVYEPGLFMGGQEWWEPQKISEAYFVESQRSKTAGRYWDYPDKKKAVALSEVDAIALSEVLKDVIELAAKGEEK